VIGEFAAANSIPLFASTEDAFKSGTLATVALDYRELGRDAAELVTTVLAGSDPAQLPIALSKAPLIAVSKQQAEALGVDLSPVRGMENVQIRE
jgi:ABC-type uncharacterized transport system substrate-binding protein